MTASPSSSRVNGPADDARLTARVVAARGADPALVARLWALFRRYYDDVAPERFADDLAAKDEIVLVETETGEAVGFSTLSVREEVVDGRLVRVLFSGDTIVDRPYWGSQVFARAWIHHLGEIHARAPDIPLLWLLIVKGHRTFRYLPTFSLRFVPDLAGRDDPDLRGLRDELARRRFGAGFDPTTGVVRFAEPRGRLADDWARIEPHHARRADVVFFLARNPGWRDGDELVCLCPVEAEAMRPFARRLFEEGAA
ncbi:MAG: hypothetical protein GX458_12335 [Phyllobacteriaceae bacterium]|nr:hypothetical protein [Phyllobacteriaceae bacterium]